MFRADSFVISRILSFASPLLLAACPQFGGQPVTEGGQRVPVPGVAAYNVVIPKIEREPNGSSYNLFAEPGQSYRLNFWVGIPDRDSLLPGARPSESVLSCNGGFDVEFQCFLCKDQTVQTQSLGRIVDGASENRAQFSFITDASVIRGDISITVSQMGIPIDRLIVPINLKRAEKAGSIPVGKARYFNPASVVSGPGVDIEISIDVRDEDIVLTFIPDSARARGILPNGPSAFRTGLNTAGAHDLLGSTFTKLNVIVGAGSGSNPTLRAVYERWRHTDPTSGSAATLMPTEQSKLISDLALVGSHIYDQLDPDVTLKRTFGAIVRLAQKESEAGTPVRLLIRNSTSVYLPWQLLYFGPVGPNGEGAEEKYFLGMVAELSEDLTRQPKYTARDTASAGKRIAPADVVLGTWRPAKDDEVAVYARMFVASFGEEWFSGSNVIEPANARQQLLDLLDGKARNVRLLAIYAHGESKGGLGDPEIRFQDKEAIIPADLGHIAGQHSRPFEGDVGTYLELRPVVILDACETNAGLTGSGQTGFAQTFLRIGSSAVVSTEASIWPSYAYHFGHDLLKQLFAGSDIEEAVFRTRRDHWTRLHNPMGLLYSVRGQPDANIAPPPH